MPVRFPGYNHPWQKYTHLERAKPSDSTSNPDFYAGPRYIGGKEGPWGNSDFLYTTLEDNTYKWDHVSSTYDPIIDNEQVQIRVGRPVHDWDHF
jgi:chloramphenicol O-acetyltransferase